jgi:hypothetical protein
LKFSKNPIDDSLEIEKNYEVNVLEIGKNLHELMPIYANIEEKDVTISLY